MAVFHIYADDSGKFETLKCEYTSLCGYVAHFSEWNRFQQEWNNCLFRWQVPPIHMRRIYYPEEDPDWKRVKDAWGASWEAKRDDMLLEFSGLVREANMVCVGAVVDAAHYRSLPDSPLKREYQDSLSLAFHQLVMRGIEKTEVIDSHSTIGIVIDDDRDSSLRCHHMLNVLKTAFPKAKERISGISFVNDRAYPGIQAADMIAYEARRLMVNKIADPLCKETDLYKNLSFWFNHQPKFYTPAILDMLQSNSLARDKDR